MRYELITVINIQYKLLQYNMNCVYNKYNTYNIIKYKKYKTYFI